MPVTIKNSQTGEETKVSDDSGSKFSWAAMLNETNETPIVEEAVEEESPLQAAAKQFEETVETVPEPEEVPFDESAAEPGVAAPVAKTASHTVATPTFHKEAAMGSVGVTLGLTMNLGDFNSAKINISLNMPTDMENLESNFDFAKQWVENKVQELAAEVENAK